MNLTLGQNFTQLGETMLATVAARVTKEKQEERQKQKEKKEKNQNK
jgi:hypothetical protein